MPCETWAPNGSDLKHLRRNDRAMIKWICNRKLTDNLSTDLLLQRLDIYGIERLRYDVLDGMDMSKDPVVILIRSLTWLSPALVDGEDQGKLVSSVSRKTYQHTI